MVATIRDADSWTWVRDLRRPGWRRPRPTHPFLTTGRQSLEDFLPWADRGVIARVVDPPEFDIPMRLDRDHLTGPVRAATASGSS